MIYGYAPVSTDGQSVTAQITQLKTNGAGKVLGEVASGAKTDRAQLRRLLGDIGPGDMVMVTRLDRLARSTRDLLTEHQKCEGDPPPRPRRRANARDCPQLQLLAQHDFTADGIRWR